MRYVFVGGPAQSHEADMEPGQANDWNKDHYTHKQQYKPDWHWVKDWTHSHVQ